MEAVNGGSLGEGGPPPPSPLTGCYLLVVVGEPHSQDHKDIILQKVAKGLLSWDVNECLVDLGKELAVITDQNLEGEEARFGERLIQFASENLVTEILIHPAVSTLSQCVRNLLSSFTRHRHIIHAGYTFQGSGSWALQDGTFSYSDFAEAFQEIEVQRVIHAYENGISIDLHCAPEGDWTRLPKESFARACKVRVNPTDVLTTGSPSISSFTKYLEPFLVPTVLEDILESSDVVGNIRFSRPTLYVFPGGQGDAALFGINGFNMLLDGGYSRKACFWDFVRHLDRLDAVLMTRLNNSSVSGVSSVLKRKRQGAVYPQIGHFFCNIQERKSPLSPDGDKDKDPLIVSLLEEGQSIIHDLKQLHLNPQTCYRDIDPIILYHKVGHGTLNMFVLSPDRNSKEVREFLQKWNQSDPKLFTATKGGKEFNFPLQNLVSICALLVWQPANPNDTITRILYPGSTPQKKIFEGIDRLKSVEYLKQPTCTVKSFVTVKKAKQEVIEKLSTKTPIITEKKTENKVLSDEPKKEMNGDAIRLKDEKPEEVKKIDEVAKENGDKAKPKMKPKVKDESQKKKLPDKKGPTTPKKSLENRKNADTKEKDRKSLTKASPDATPAKSAKDATNRKVVESKKAPQKKETTPKPPAEVKPKPERKPISRRPKTVKGPPSPLKKMTNGTQKPDTLFKRGKLDKEGTTDSSTVSTPSADQDSILKKDISKMTPEEIQQLKEQELEELKEEQEVNKEIEAVFRGSEAQEIESESGGVRVVKETSIDDHLETEEYLIVEKEDIEHDSIDQEAKEDEMQKLVRDSEESEKQRKLSSDEEKKIKGEDDVKEVVESQPDEKVESGATTTAPTLPEDERITLDEIKEGQQPPIIEEKHVKEETKEKELPVIQLPPKIEPEISKQPLPLDKQKHVKDIVKTPDEVADLPVHEEADYQEFPSEDKKVTNEVTKKTDEVLEKADTETKEKPDQDNNLIKTELKETLEDEWVVVTKEEEVKPSRPTSGLDLTPTHLDESKIKIEDKDSDSEANEHEIRKEDEIQELLEKDTEDIKALIEEADKKDELEKITAIKEAKKEIANLDVKLQELKKEIPIEESVKPAAKPADLKPTTEKVEEELETLDQIPPVLKELADIDKAELGRKSPAEREEDVKKIVASVAEVLKSDAPLEELTKPFSFTQELRETHITTQDSPISDVKIIKTDDIPPIPEEPAEDDAKKETQSLETELEKEDDTTVHRMLVTASSEDGGEEIEICPAGTITFSRSSESSGRSSPEPSVKSHKSSVTESVLTEKQASLKTEESKTDFKPSVQAEDSKVSDKQATPLVGDDKDTTKSEVKAEPERIEAKADSKDEVFHKLEEETLQKSDAESSITDSVKEVVHEEVKKLIDEVKTQNEIESALPADRNLKEATQDAKVDVKPKSISEETTKVQSDKSLAEEIKKEVSHEEKEKVETQDITQDETQNVLEQLNVSASKEEQKLEEAHSLEHPEETSDSSKVLLSKEEIPSQEFKKPEEETHNLEKESVKQKEPPPIQETKLQKTEDETTEKVLVSADKEPAKEEQKVSKSELFNEEVLAEKDESRELKIEAVKALEVVDQKESANEEEQPSLEKSLPEVKEKEELKIDVITTAEKQKSSIDHLESAKEELKSTENLEDKKKSTECLEVTTVEKDLIESTKEQLPEEKEKLLEKTVQEVKPTVESAKEEKTTKIGETVLLEDKDVKIQKIETEFVEKVDSTKEQTTKINDKSEDKDIKATEVGEKDQKESVKEDLKSSTNEITLAEDKSPADANKITEIVTEKTDKKPVKEEQKTVTDTQHEQETIEDHIITEKIDKEEKVDLNILPGKVENIQEVVEDHKPTDEIPEKIGKPPTEQLSSIIEPIADRVLSVEKEDLKTKEDGSVKAADDQKSTDKEDLISEKIFEKEEKPVAELKIDDVISQEADLKTTKILDESEKQLSKEEHILAEKEDKLSEKSKIEEVKLLEDKKASTKKLEDASEPILQKEEKTPEISFEKTTEKSVEEIVKDPAKEEPKSVSEQTLIEEKQIHEDKLEKGLEDVKAVEEIEDIKTERKASIIEATEDFLLKAEKGLEAAITSVGESIKDFLHEERKTSPELITSKAEDEQKKRSVEDHKDGNIAKLEHTVTENNLPKENGQEDKHIKATEDFIAKTEKALEAAVSSISDEIKDVVPEKSPESPKTDKPKEETEQSIKDSAKAAVDKGEVKQEKIEEKERKSSIIEPTQSAVKELEPEEIKLSSTDIKSDEKVPTEYQKDIDIVVKDSLIKDSKEKEELILHEEQKTEEKPEQKSEIIIATGVKSEEKLEAPVSSVEVKSEEKILTIEKTPQPEKIPETPSKTEEKEEEDHKEKPAKPERKSSIIETTKDFLVKSEERIETALSSVAEGVKDIVHDFLPEEKTELKQDQKDTAMDLESTEKKPDSKSTISEAKAEDKVLEPISTDNLPKEEKDHKEDVKVQDIKDETVDKTKLERKASVIEAAEELLVKAEKSLETAIFSVGDTIKDSFHHILPQEDKQSTEKLEFSDKTAEQESLCKDKTPEQEKDATKPKGQEDLEPEAGKVLERKQSIIEATEEFLVKSEKSFESAILSVGETVKHALFDDKTAEVKEETNKQEPTKAVKDVCKESKVEKEASAICLIEDKEAIEKESDRKSSLIEAAEEFLEKSEEKLESVLSSIGEAAKNVFQEEKKTDEIKTLEEPKVVTTETNLKSELESANKFTSQKEEKPKHEEQVSKEESEQAKETEKPEPVISEVESAKKSTDQSKDSAQPNTKTEIEDKTLERRTSIIEATEEFIEKSEHTLGSMFTAIGEAAKGVLHGLMPEESEKPDEKVSKVEAEEIAKSTLPSKEVKTEDVLKEERDIPKTELPDKTELTTTTTKVDDHKPVIEVPVIEEFKASTQDKVDSKPFKPTKEDLESKRDDSDFKLDKTTLEKEEQRLEEQAEMLEKKYDDLCILEKRVSFDKCKDVDDYKFDKEILKKEERQIEDEANELSRSYEDLSKLTESVHFEKCPSPEECKLDKDTLKKEERQLEDAAKELRRSYEDLSTLAESVQFDKCPPPDEYKFDKEVLKKEERQIEDEADALRRSYEDLSKLTESVHFDTYSAPSQFHIAEKELKKNEDTTKECKLDKDTLKKEERQLEDEAKELQRNYEDATQLSESLKFDKCPPADECKFDKEVLKKEERQIEDEADALRRSYEDLSKLTESVHFDTCPTPNQFHVDESVLKKEERQIEDQVTELQRDYEDLSKLSKEVHFDKCHSLQEPEKDRKMGDVGDALRRSREDLTDLGDETDNWKREDKKEEKDTTKLTVDSGEAKKLSISDVEISLKTEPDHVKVSSSFLENERAASDSFDAKVPSSGIPQSSSLSISTESGSPKPQEEIPTSPSLKHDSGLSEQTETDEDDLSTKSQVAHSQSDLEELDPMSTSFYGALPKEFDDAPPTYLYEITKAKYSTEVKIDDRECYKEEVEKVTASATPKPSSSSQDTAKLLDNWGPPLGLPAPSYLGEETDSGRSEDMDVMTCSFIGEELPTTTRKSSNVKVYHEDVGANGMAEEKLIDEPTTRNRREEDPMTASVYGEDPIASWGKPLGLPSPAPPNNNGTPKKEKKLSSYVSAKNKLNDDKKRAESPSKMRGKKVNPVYVDLTYVPHHGNHYYSFVDFFKRVRARYYVFSGLEPSRQVYDALLEAKTTWDDKDLEVTIIPTYDTDILGYWVAENEDQLSKLKIDLAPSASRCTINLQDHETSCSAYRLEF